MKSIQPCEYGFTLHHPETMTLTIIDDVVLQEPSYKKWENSLATCVEEKVAQAKEYAKPRKKGKKAMYDEFDDCCQSAPMTTDQRQREYLKSRLHAISENKYRELNKAFYIDDDERPETPNALVKRIQDGLFVIPEGQGDKRYYSPADRLQWRDPAKKPNQDGFDKAIAARDKSEVETMDTIQIMAPEAGLKALQEFEAATFH